MGIVAFPKEHASIDIIPFKKDRLVLICNPENQLAKLDRIENLELLQALPFCAFEKDIPTRKHIDRLLEDNNIRVNIQMDFDNIETIKRMVEVDDNLVSIVPSSTITREVEMGTLKSISILDDKFLRPIAVIIKKGKNLSKASKNFIRLLKEYDPGKEDIELSSCCNR
jgi:DNA-binding transcriptional LysR family regulator